MAVPFRRTSKMRKRTRRSHHALSIPTAHSCPKCGSNVLSHHVCSSCGNYNSQKVL